MASSSVVHIIDDDEDVRRSLAFLLGTAGIPAISHDGALAFLDKLASLADGCVVTDVRMPGMDGLQLQKRLKALRPDMPVIVMTGHGDVPLAVEAMKEGALDFIEKPFEDEHMIATVRAALDRLSHKERREKESAEVLARVETLSQRERQVLEGLVAGRPNKTIAYDLELSPRTVEVHRANVMTKMAAASLSDLVRMALMAGLMPPR